MAESLGVQPALASRGIDRSAGERLDADLLDRLREAASTRVLVVSGDRAAMRGDNLILMAPGDLPVAAVDNAEWAFLGRADDGAGVLMAALDPVGGEPAVGSDADAGAQWAALRDVGGVLPPTDAALFVEAVSLSRWLREAPFCPFCGARTRVEQAGWARRCPHCGREHFPRTDPAVIMIATSAIDSDRVLLGSNAAWGAGRFSCFAGFVEAGESLESAVARELEEEAGIRVADIRYRSSQAWPYPRSLMLGFEARSVDDTLARADGEEIAEVRWFSRAEIRASLAGVDDPRDDGGVLLPGTSSIAYRLIADWCAAG
jgi:NAD+ diphosphatase